MTLPLSHHLARCPTSYLDIGIPTLYMALGVINRLWVMGYPYLHEYIVYTHSACSFLIMCVSVLENTPLVQFA